jgi:uncharacterized protein YehS (DUF1456 family)
MEWTNKVYVKLCAALSPLYDDEIVKFLIVGGFEASKSKAVSWRKPPGHKNYSKMPEEALWALFDGLIKDNKQAKSEA